MTMNCMGHRPGGAGPGFWSYDLHMQHAHPHARTAGFRAQPPDFCCHMTVISYDHFSPVIFGPAIYPAPVNFLSYDSHII